MLNHFIVINFPVLTGLIFLVLFLLTNRALDKSVQRTFYLLVILEIVELIAFSSELWTASFAEPTMWRVLVCAIGYGIRPILLLCILQMVMRSEIGEKQSFMLAIPALINVVAAFSAFFTDLVYSFDEKNQFVRGPLGYVTHVVLVFYLVCLLLISIKRSETSRLESVIVWAICLIIILAIVMEAVFPVYNISRTAMVLSTLAYYLFFQTIIYQEEIRGYMEQTFRDQKEHLREMNIIGILANEYVTVCYVDVEKDIVTPYRMDPYIEERYGDVLRSESSFEHIFRTYIAKDILEEDRDFFLNLANLQEMLSYLRQNGRIARKYRVERDGMMLYCEMRAELVSTDSDVEDIVIGFSNNDSRVRKEMIYKSTVQQEIDKVMETKESLSGIARLAKQLQEAIEEKLLEL